ncbi:23S rRNA (guanosine(2251)-2'-O)-methyltransferase RlmB [Criibacterium bergeronii]|uniref:23S rRNA (Guanosine(2251)-2'-O)-methyltransferase RlmB n=1 Tax=Criibacterium bergeronii TaxID=1871336 RepID=A0A371IN06_9FIRM|nr:23S rRNA (guanosine(2251)-2'-O)-methyltransferase RlmB [Criibacterium bergeronii]MBS6062509.1 23S rRNA (guanosine(2251)-2'-O)-methyltransferase RlmB [Peptostreptococcaceae bacterium]RDY21867.1 23S rRNA (guanosine(2251)-2'-O)-methyltransferase RlmB [Criibacterium bergeronii]
MNLIIGKNPSIEAIKSGRKIETVYVTQNENDEKIKYIVSSAKDKNITIKNVDKKKLDTLAKGENHQGVILGVAEYEYYDFEKLLKDLETNKQNQKRTTMVILDKIEDVHNLGSIVRSSEGAGVDAVIIQKTNAAGVTPVVEKASSGATSFMKIVRVTNITTTIKKLQDAGMWIYALDMGDKMYYEQDLTGDVAIVVGSEGKGVSRLVKENCDFIISIPMNGQINSLNAGVAASIVLYDVVRQRTLKNV